MPEDDSVRFGMVIALVMMIVRYLVIGGVVVIVSVFAVPDSLRAIAGKDTHFEMSLVFQASVLLNIVGLPVIISLWLRNRNYRSRVRGIEKRRRSDDTLPISVRGSTVLR